MNSKVVCIYGAKGGIGKTTIALNLAGVFSNLMKSVLIIDWDLYHGDIAVSLNKNASKTIYDLSEDLKKNDAPNINDYITKYNKYLSFVAAPKDPREAQKIDINCVDYLINIASKLYDIIIFDTTPLYDEANIKALKIADKVFFITTNNPLDLKNTRNTLAILNDEKIKNINVILNNSIHPNNDYYILYDIKKIINKNVDYIISNRFHYKDIDTVTVNGEILTIRSQKWNDYKIFLLIAENLLK